MSDSKEPFMRELKAEARRTVAMLAQDDLRLELELFEAYLKENARLIKKMYDEMDPEDDRAERYVERRAMYSHVIYLASLLETYLKRACARVERTRPQEEADEARNGRFRLRDIAGDKWDQPKRFLEVYLRFPFPASWSALRSLADVRNFLVHDNGSLESLERDARKAKRASFQNLGLDIDGLELVITEGFITSTLSAFRNVVEQIENRLKAELERAESPLAVPP
jgi:hypothetical protein